MTPEEAIADLRALRAATPGILEEQLTETARQGADLVAARWPRHTGESAEAWDNDGPAVVNDAPHTPHVHDGLAYRLVPEVLEGLEDDTAARIDTEIRRVAGWED